jgi:hypothetical protein
MKRFQIIESLHMSQPAPTIFDQLSKAISSGDVVTLQALLDAGADINTVQGKWGETAFFDALDSISYVSEDGITESYPDGVLQAIRLACQHGALLYPNSVDDAYFSDNNPGGVMSSALYALDTAVIATLLDCGFDPNWCNRVILAQQLQWRQSALDLADEQYCEILYGINCWPPERYAGEDYAYPSLAYFDYLDRLAVRQGIRRPDHLFLLHHFGARTHTEWLEQALAPQAWTAPQPDAAKVQALAHCIVRDDWVGLQQLLRVGWHLNLSAQLPREGPLLHTPVTWAFECLYRQDQQQGCAVDRSPLLVKLFTLGVEANNPAMCSPGMGLFGPALQHRDAAMLKCLLELGCNPNLPRGQSGETVLEMAYHAAHAVAHPGELPRLQDCGARTAIDLMNTLFESHFWGMKQRMPQK